MHILLNDTKLDILFSHFVLFISFSHVSYSKLYAIYYQKFLKSFHLTTLRATKNFDAQHIIVYIFYNFVMYIQSHIFFQARKEYLYGPKIIESPDGLLTSKLLLSFKVKSNHFRNGRMKLICEAIISQAHTLRSEEILISNKSTLRSVFSDYGKCLSNILK